MTTAMEPGFIPQFEKFDRAKKALTVKHVTSAEMADYVGVTRETMSRYLSGKAPIPRATLRLIALRTGVPYEWLETGQVTDGPGDGGAPIV